MPIARWNFWTSWNNWIELAMMATVTKLILHRPYNSTFIRFKSSDIRAIYNFDLRSLDCLMCFHFCGLEFFFLVRMTLHSYLSSVRDWNGKFLHIFKSFESKHKLYKVTKLNIACSFTGIALNFPIIRGNIHGKVSALKNQVLWLWYWTKPIILAERKESKIINSISTS